MRRATRPGVFARGVDICHETVRKWGNRFGPMFAAKIRSRRVQAMRQHTHWRWHLDEVYVRVQGEMRFLWRAVDHEGEGWCWSGCVRLLERCWSPLLAQP
jgi:transposase-like protein